MKQPVPAATRNVGVENASTQMDGLLGRQQWLRHVAGSDQRVCWVDGSGSGPDQSRKTKRKKRFIEVR